MIGSRARHSERTARFDVAHDDEAMRKCAHKIITKIQQKSEHSESCKNKWFLALIKETKIDYPG
jgi:hypothetical protein